MTGFDLLTNYINDPEALLKITKAKLKKVSALESEDKQIRQSLTPEFKAMADKTLHEFSAQLPPTFILDQQSMLGTMDSSSSWLLST
jgi:hypothetical protein